MAKPTAKQIAKLPAPLLAAIRKGNTGAVKGKGSTKKGK